MKMEEISNSFCCCSRHQANGRRRRSRREMNMGRRGPLFTVALLLLSALLPSAIASSTSRLRGKKRRTKSLYNGVPQHGAQRPSVPSQYDENMRKLILIASSSNKNNDDEREEARRILATIMGNTDEADQQHRELAQKKINGNNKRTKQQRTKQQRQRIKRLNAQRKKKNAERQKKKQMMQILKQQSSQKEKENKDDKDDKQTDGKFSFGPPPPEKPKPQNSAGSFSAYQTGNSMADAFVDSLASSFVSNGGGGGGGGSTSTAEIQEASSSVSSSRDTQIDGFETSPSKLDWEFSTKNPWKVTSDASYEGRSSMMSGLPPSSKNVVLGKSLYSNMTLSLTNEDLNQAIGKGKDGAVLSFQVKATEALSWPISSFMVTLNDKMVLSPSETESFASSMWKKNEWAEFSIVIDTVAGSSAKYDVKFIHVANPLKLEKLPDVPDALKLYIDDVRLAPFTRKVEPLEIEMTTSFSGSKWNEVTGVYVATSASIGKESGYVDLNLVVYSRLGGRLKYQLKTSTQGPFDDLATLINGKLQDAQFGESANFEYAEVEIPRGKAVITIRHRKNPGNLTSNTLGKLGTVTTEGTNRVKNIEFVATQ